MLLIFLFDKNLLSLEGSIGNAVFYVKKIVARSDTAYHFKSATIPDSARVCSSGSYTQADRSRLSYTNKTLDKSALFLAPKPDLFIFSEYTVKDEI